MKRFFQIFLLSFLFFGTTFASQGTQTLTKTYYMGDVSECRFMVQYTCEYGYQKFSDARGCGCTLKDFGTQNQGYLIPQNANTHQYYSGQSQNPYYNGQYQNNNYQMITIPQNISHTVSRNCNNETRQVCGAPKNNCVGNNCPILHPRTYKNICQMQAVQATFLTNGECQTYNRTNYNSYMSQNYKNNYSVSDTDYLMYLVSEFINDLERKNYSDAKMVTTIERVITRLKDLGNNNTSYRNATRSAILELEDYKKRFEKRDAYREIENIFERY